jgi:putative two-component system response regulator
MPAVVLGVPVSVTRVRREMWRDGATSRVLVVDDDPFVATSVAQMLERDGHETVVAHDVREARRRLLGDRVNVLVCDVRLPGESGLSLAQEIARDHPAVGLVMMSGSEQLEFVDTALESGADGFLVKPFRGEELLAAVSSALRQRNLRGLSIVESSRHQSEVAVLQVQLREAYLALAGARRETVHRLALAAERRVPAIGPHLRRVGAMTDLVALRLGWTPDQSEALGVASTLHDVGKIAMPDSVLLKPGPLTAEERDMMNAHAVIGYEMLSGSGDALLDVAATIALTHHERMDGTGYRNGLAGQAIPIEGRIVAVVDMFDSLTNDRPYRAAMSTAGAIAELRAGRDRHLDPTVLDALPDSLEETSEPLRSTARGR